MARSAHDAARRVGFRASRTAQSAKVAERSDASQAGDEAHALLNIETIEVMSEATYDERSTTLRALCC